MRLFNRLALGALLGALLVACTAFLTPSARAQDVPPELSPNLGWLNTDRPLRFSDELKGHVVVLDFWTYCCINCMHVLPDLEYLEEHFKDEPVVVIGVHSAKFTNEGDRQSIRNAVQRYGVKHPVVIDDGMAIWKKYGVHSWPTFVVIGPDGMVADAASGEGLRAPLTQLVQRLLDKGRKNGTLAHAKVRLAPDAIVAASGPLRFPGKVLAVPPRAGFAGALFISDSSNNRVVHASWPDASGAAPVVQVFGIGDPGLADGTPGSCGFYDPQGLAFDDASNTLYVADTKDHAVRAIDLKSGEVTTIAGRGEQGYDRRGGKPGAELSLNSPWDVALSPDHSTLYIAMAGSHQIWTLDLKTRTAAAFAGSGGENIADGAADSALLAQTSGLALSSDGRTLFFVDSETSSVRRLDIEAKRVRTIIGRGLFDYGDDDGAYPAATLQHCLGVTLYATPGGDRLLVADTYNHKIKLIDPDAKTSRTFLGVGRPAPGREPAPGELALDEPAGLCFAPATQATPAALFIADTNNHRIIMADPATKAWKEVMLPGLRPPEAKAGIPDGATEISVPAAPGKPLTLSLSVPLPANTHLNPEAPTTARAALATAKGLRTIATRTVRTKALPVTIGLPAAEVAEGAKIVVELSFATCTDADAGLCVPGDAAWVVTLTKGGASSAALDVPAMPPGPK